MKPREYCCCAIPVIYTGIYTALTEQFVLGIVAGTLSIATPSIVGAASATPSAAKWITAIICYVGAALQLMGFAAVRNEKPTMFRRYTTLHLIVTLGAFSVAAVWIILSAARHSQAVTACKSTFFGTDSDLQDEATTLCDIFPWVDVGIMGGLWAYLYFVLSAYIAGQELAHSRYDSMYDATKPLASDIPLTERADPWDTSMDSPPRGYHDRSESIDSVSTVMGNKVHQPREYDGYGQTSYRPEERHDADTSAQNIGSTAVVNDGYTHGYHSGTDYPDHS
ncbi:uncharacterized protein C8Q71DRAFT_857437 [Rhodofomes roseus]|uniref:Transmembrane protein n=1 Tax=Rhodofomes roseus TaxID=34475 RepID=A0A4Y9XRM2_9APHY|nr:uncharacterized protein C8Q71DRAFT_857437 [Rhodofomes roseus]KAH9837120.1 hypothetical protein C8Q71DRAFT_857437 [Rhodofomes roseus]TFY52736.1 hypothetical protein EVJ58_g9847 [Rhodofomes roseus]